MLEGQVRWRVLLTTGLVTGTATAVFAATARLWMPGVVTKDQAQFGFFGIALALVTWFSVVSTIVMVGACAGAVAAEDTGWIGRWVRGGEDTVLAPGAAESFPAPTRTMRLSDAIGINADQDDEDED